METEYNNCIAYGNYCCLTLTTYVVTIGTMALGKNVKELRLAAGLTQTQLAELAGMDQQALAMLEKRDSKSSSFTTALANALNTSVDTLLGGAALNGLQEVRPTIAERLIDPDELEELISLFCGATTYGRKQMLRAARVSEQRRASRAAPAAND